MNTSSIRMNLWLRVFIILLLLCLFTLLLLDFAALNDIHNEYISKPILQRLGIELSKQAPGWTENLGEWDYLRLSLLAKLVCYLVLFFIIVFIGEKKSKY